MPLFCILMSSGSISISLKSSLHKESDRLRLLIAELTKSMFLADKLQSYKRILYRTRRSLKQFEAENFSMTGLHTPSALLPVGIEEMIRWTRLKNKLKLLEQMIHVTGRLQKDYNEGGELFLLRLEKDLGEFLDEEDRNPESRESGLPFECLHQGSVPVREELRRMRVRLGALLKKLYIKIYRDLRRQVRFITRLFLPNLDDEDNVAGVIVANTSISFCNYLIHHHGKRRVCCPYQFG